MGTLINGLRSVLATLTPEENALVVRAFNNEPELYRSSRRRPRTDLMVKGLRGSRFEVHGLVAQAAGVLEPKPDREIGYERYTDISISYGNWWKGEKYVELAVEVENCWGELAGTLKDLLWFQATRKWAVFYSSNLQAAGTELSDTIDRVRTSFETQGSQENADTQYEIAVFPDSVSCSGLIGVEMLEVVFSSKEMRRRLTPAKIVL